MFSAISVAEWILIGWWWTCAAIVQHYSLGWRPKGLVWFLQSAIDFLTAPVSAAVALRQSMPRWRAEDAKAHRHPDDEFEDFYQEFLDLSDAKRHTIINRLCLGCNRDYVSCLKAPCPKRKEGKA